MKLTSRTVGVVAVIGLMFAIAGGPLVVGRSLPLTLQSQGDLYEAMEGYPPPPVATATPFNLDDGEFSDAEASDVASTILQRWIDRGWASEGSAVRKAIDVDASDADWLHLAERLVARHGLDDVAIALEGEFKIDRPGMHRVHPEPYLFAVVVVNRFLGSQYAIRAFDDVDNIPEQLR